MARTRSSSSRKRGAPAASAGAAAGGAAAARPGQGGGSGAKRKRPNTPTAVTPELLETKRREWRQDEGALREAERAVEEAKHRAAKVGPA